MGLFLQYYVHFCSFLDYSLCDCNCQKKRLVNPWTITQVAPNATSLIKLSTVKNWQIHFTYSGKHSATFITENANEVARFMQKVAYADVYHNVSTRFTDGEQIGIGAE